MRFCTSAAFPDEYRGHVFIVEHGSWNRSVPIGYRVMLLKLEGNEAVSCEVFAEGWLTGRRVWGRPEDLLFLPDGSMLLSDDRAGVVYRITWAGERR
jgi:glucose/arabinose dehydrogenase